MRILGLAVTLLLVAGAVALSEEPVAAESILDTFTSDTAQKSVNAYRERITVLEQDFAEQIRAEQSKLNELLKSAIKAAIDEGDIQEAARITDYLSESTETEPDQAASVPEKPKSTARIQQARSRAMSHGSKAGAFLLSGHWIRSDGIAFEIAVDATFTEIATLPNQTVDDRHKHGVIAFSHGYVFFCYPKAAGKTFVYQAVSPTLLKRTDSRFTIQRSTK